MKYINIIKSAGIVVLAALGTAMAMTNPSQSDYEEYALEQLTDYLKDNVCTQAPKDFDNFLRRQCKTLVDSGRPQLRKMIAENTDQQNFLIFSIYHTELSVGPFLPSYNFETVAAFNKFYIYQAERS